MEQTSKSFSLHHLKKRAQELLRDRPNLILTLAVAGIILIAVTYIWDEQPEPVTVSDATGFTLAEDARQLEERLTEIIGQVAGAGETCVMVTMDTTRESVYAEDITSQRRSTQTGELGSGDEDFSEERTHVLLGNGSEESPLVEKRIEPTVRGVLILCEGAEDPVVEARVTEAVRTVLGISSSQICVEKISN